MPRLELGLQGLIKDKNMKMKSNIPTFFLYLNIYVTMKY